MPRPAPAGKPCALETTKQARRAYVRAGGRVFTVEEIRRAEREAAKDKLARTIEANEKRRAEKERRRREKETKEKEEQKKLVQQGKLPRESLWGRVRSSQPRLHHFFPKPQQAEEAGVEDGDKVGLLGDGGSKSEEESPSLVEEEEEEEDVEGKSPGHQGPSSSPAPAFHDRTTAETSQNQDTVADSGLGEDQYDVPRKKLDAQLSFSASQLSSQFADDADLEAELNGASLPSELLGRVSPKRPGSHALAQKASPLRKRKVENELSATLPLAQTARAALTELPACQLNQRAQQQRGQLYKASATGPGVKVPTKAADCPTDLPIEVTSAVEQFRCDNSDVRGEKRGPQHTVPKARPNSHTSYVGGWWEIDAAAPCPVLANTSPPSRNSPPRSLRATHDPSRNDTDPETEFEGDLTDEDFELASFDVNVSEAVTALTPSPGRSRNGYSSATARPADFQQPPPSPRLPSMGIQPCLAEPQPSTNGHNLPSGTQSSWCDFDNGVSDADLAGLLDGFNNSRNQKGSPQWEQRQPPEPWEGHSVGHFHTGREG